MTVPIPVSISNPEDVVQEEWMPSCEMEKNLAACNCSYEGCDRKGKCCECLVYHRKSGELPACYFPADMEKRYDRSVNAFVQVFRSRGKWW